MVYMLNRELSVTPLGTVSTYCNDRKNCPGFFVKYGEHKILLDCGNGISRYLKMPDDLEGLVIIISHLHSDHYGELLSLAQTSFVFHRLGMLKNRIKVYLPEEDKDLIDYIYLLNLQKESYFEFVPYREQHRLYFDDLKLSFARNPHPLATYSTKLENDNTKLVYSSDTGYVGNSLEDFAKDADMLICESTFLRNQKGDNDNHLTAYEAGKIAAAANVDTLLLTHFWPDIDKYEYMREARKVFSKTFVAEEDIKLVLK